MGDLYLGLAVMAALSAVVFAVALQFRKAVPHCVCDLLAIVTILTMVLYIRDMWDNMFLERLLPYSNLIIIGNWLPLGTSFLAGLAWHRVPGRIWRKALSAVSLLLVAGYAQLHPLLGRPPHCTNMWSEGVSLQTTDATCSAACAATLLRAHGIAATEQEMAELCLTRRNGTNWQGLYRGLKLKTAGTPWDVEVFRCRLSELHQKLPGPVILTVQLNPPFRSENPDAWSTLLAIFSSNQSLAPAADRIERYTKDFGWVPGVSHSAVLFRFTSDGHQVEMGDPSVGREDWSRDDLRVLWHGDGMRLVPRLGAGDGLR